MRRFLLNSLAVGVLGVLVGGASACADGAYFSFGNALHKATYPSSRMFSVSLQQELPKGLLLQQKASFVSTPGYTPGGAGLLGGSLGIQVEAWQYLRLQGLWGPAYYTRKDRQLGGPFQFTHDLCADLNNSHTSIGACYTHVSSAGIEKPNVGLDVIQLRLGIKF